MDVINFPEDKAPENTMLNPTAFGSRSLCSVKLSYSNIEWVALGILCSLEMFHHYCFSREVSMTTDHKPLVMIFQKDVVILSQKIIQCNLMRIQTKA